MTFDHLVTTRHLAGLEAALVSAARALVAVYPDVHRERLPDEPIQVTTARSLVDDCEHLLAAIDDYRAQLITGAPKNPEQLDWPF